MRQSHPKIIKPKRKFFGQHRLRQDFEAARREIADELKKTLYDAQEAVVASGSEAGHINPWSG